MDNNMFAPPAGPLWMLVLHCSFCCSVAFKQSGCGHPCTQAPGSHQLCPCKHLGVLCGGDRGPCPNPHVPPGLLGARGYALPPAQRRGSSCLRAWVAQEGPPTARPLPSPVTWTFHWAWAAPGPQGRHPGCFQLVDQRGAKGRGDPRASKEVSGSSRILISDMVSPLVSLFHFY